MKKLIVSFILVALMITLGACEEGTNDDNLTPEVFDINDLQVCITDIETADNESGCEVNYRNQLFMDFASQYLDTFDYPTPLLTNVMFNYAKDGSNEPFFQFNLNFENIPTTQATADYDTFRLAFEEMRQELDDLATAQIFVTFSYQFENDELSIAFGEIETRSSRTIVENVDNSMTTMIDDYDDYVVSMSTDTDYEVVVFKLVTDENIVTITMYPGEGEYQTVVSELVTSPSMSVAEIETLLEAVMAQTTLTEMS